MFISHFGITVDNAAKAAAYYGRLFGMRVVIREAKINGTWATVPEDMTDAEAARLGLNIGMFVLREEMFALSLQETERAPPQALEHVALVIPPPLFSELKARAVAMGCQVFKSSQGRYVFADHHRMIWEITDRDVLLSAHDTTGARIDSKGQLIQDSVRTEVCL